MGSIVFLIAFVVYSIVVTIFLFILLRRIDRIHDSFDELIIKFIDVNQRFYENHKSMIRSLSESIERVKHINENSIGGLTKSIDINNIQMKTGLNILINSIKKISPKSEKQNT